MTDLWWGFVFGAVAVGVAGGPIASRVSALLESRWDAAADRSAASDAVVARVVDELVADDALFAAYQAQYWTWAGLVGGCAIAVALIGFIVAWALDRSGSSTAAATVAAATAVVTGGTAVFWSRKLVAKRRVTRLVYRRRLQLAR